MAEPTPTCSKFFLFLVATWFGQLRGGPLRYLGFASSRATKIYGDLAKIYGASPQFFATVSGLSFAHKTQRAKSEINVFSIEDRVLHAPVPHAHSGSSVHLYAVDLVIQELGGPTVVVDRSS